MSTEITYGGGDGLIIVREYGVLSTEGFISTVQSIQEIYEKTAIAKVLVDTREQESVSGELDLYERAKHAARHLGRARMRVAIVVAEPLAGGHEFFATVSKNRGLSISVFAEEAAARAWLAE